ncbi:GNAT family N-acetyltransferase [Actinomadura sp. DSM 109109]|nr:GNAT family N-acetyltransferase [Actinomadura lepetitiana]
MSTEITDDPGQGRYEIRLDGELAGFAEYERGEGAVVFLHTEIDPAFEGRGVGSALARGALDDVRSKGLSVVPLCPFIKKWIGRHPDYRDLVR